MRYLAMIVLSTAALGFAPGRYAADPAAYGPARWAHGRLSDGGPVGWFLVRDTHDGPVVYAVDQPSGQKLPSYTHFRGPAQSPAGFLSGGASLAGQAATNGVLVGAMAGLAGHGPMVITDGSEASDKVALNVMEQAASAERPCPPNGPCPNRPDPEPEPEPDEPEDEPEASPLDRYRRLFLPGALLGVGALFAYRVKRLREGR